MNRVPAAMLFFLVTACGWSASAQPTGSNWLVGRPDATIDLTSRDGVALVNGGWRYADATIVPIESPSLGSDLRASGPLARTWDIEPKAGASDFDDSSWLQISPPQPSDRRGNGRLSLGWYRIAVTLPQQVGDFAVDGSRVALEVVVDDYAEVWVDGRLQSQIPGQTGGSFVRGWNAPNRVVLTRNAQSGQTFQISVLAINAPLSAPPANFVWFRSATLDFHLAADRSVTVPLAVDRLDSRLDRLIPSDTALQKIASGFTFTEGPVWTRGVDGEPGFLLFSDPNENTIYRLTEDGELSEFRTKSGYTGVDIGHYRQPGSNGLVRDPLQQRLTICQHGNRRVVRIEPNGLVTVLADRFQGKRLNSPNDLVYRSDGALFFTDPPFGLPKFHDDPDKELPFSGVFALVEGQLRLVSDQLSGPNGLAWSPDERFLYVGNWDEQAKTVVRYEIDSAGAVLGHQLFCDLTSAAGDDAIDGIKVDVEGNVYVSGPGGLWIFSADGQQLGAVRPPEHPHNLCFGGEDGRTLYLTCQTGVYRLRTGVPGVGLAASAEVSTRNRSRKP